MKVINLVTSFTLLVPILLTQNFSPSSLAKETGHNQVFNVWWNKKKNDAKVIFNMETNSSSATMQVDDGLPIFKEQVLEVYREVIKKRFRSEYIYHITYKDENSKVSEAKIIFINEDASRRFQIALEDFGVK